MKCNSMGVKLFKTSRRGLPSLVVAFPANDDGYDYMADMLGKRMTVARMASEGVSLYSLTTDIASGHDQKLEVRAQDQAEFDYMERLVGCELVVAATQALQPDRKDWKMKWYSLTPDVSQPRATETDISQQSTDDLVTELVSKGVPVKKNTLRADLERIWQVMQVDKEAAIVLAEKARPELPKRKAREDVKQFSVGNAPAETRSANQLI